MEIYEIKGRGKKLKVGTLWESMEYMAYELKAPLAIHNSETGLSLSMMVLAEEETMTLEDSNGDLITITRLKKEN